ncbi:MAG: hypothetical protein GY707_17390 [Desulfobacteraceae bacterium]|nr:hypothetical protein [Desulfobacteraceae bacterium]
MPNRKGWMAILFIFFILSIPFAIAYYVSSSSYSEKVDQWRKSSTEDRLFDHSKVSDEQVVLVKNEKVVVDRTCLIFKDVNKKGVQLDLYLLDLDVEQSYPFFVKKNSKKKFWLGNAQYSFVSVNKRALKLKVLNRYNTP